jgi:rSAM/selenodomain-associated transferase 1
VNSAVVVMARSPDHERERIKSRLAPVLPEPSHRQALYAAFLADTLGNARAGAAACDAIVRVAFTPAGAEKAFARFGVAREELLSQRGETLGDRERNIFEDMFRAGSRHVVIVGSDLPTLPPVHIEEAFGGLDRERPALVLGPSGDGGYYLIGLNASAAREAVPDLFSTIRWSSPHTLSDTLAAAEKAGLAVRLLLRWHDVDEPEDLARLRVELADPATAARASATAEVLRRWSVI